MTKLVMATNNANKLREAREILSPLGIEVLSLADIDIDCDPDENGATFEENAMIKANAVYETVKIPVIADDSGLCVEALGGRPGVFSARYAPKGEECRKLLEEMKNVPDSERDAYFKCSIAYVDEKSSWTVSGMCIGKIGYEEKGTNGFGYDPVFEYAGKTLAEMTSEEKNAISHRGAALISLYEIFEREEMNNADK